MRANIFALIFAAFLVKEIEGYASYFANDGYCYQDLYDGVTMMNNVVHYSSSKTVVIKRGGTTLSSGANYVAGESLTVTISSSANEYAFQVASGDATFNSGACSNTRKANGAATLIMPSSGTVVINGAWAQTEGTAAMMNDFTLNCCQTSTPTTAPVTRAPTKTPTVVPTVLPTVIPTGVPVLSPTVGPTTGSPTLTPTVAPTATFTSPTFLPSTHPSFSPSVGPSLAPSAIPTIAPTQKPSVKPTIAPTYQATNPPTEAPSQAPTYLTETSIIYQVSQVVNNITAEAVLDNQAAFVNSMMTSLNTFLPPVSMYIVSPTPDRRLAAENVGSITVIYGVAYLLEATEYQTSSELESALTLANNIISNSNLFVNTLKDQGVQALIGVTSTSADGVAVGSTSLLKTVAPTEHPTPVSYDATADDTFYNGSMTAKVATGVIVGFFGVLIALGSLHYFLFNHETLSASYGEISKKVPAWLAIAMGITALILVSTWATTHKDSEDRSYLGKPNWKDNVFAYHPVFLVAGFYFAQLIAINNWTMFDSHALGKGAHVFFHMTGLAFMITGMCAVVKYKLESKSPSLTTMHSWIGVAAVSIFCVNYANGFFMGLVTAMWPDSVIRKAFDLRRVHQAMGLMSLGLTTIAVVSGIMDQLAEGSCFYNTSTFEADKDPAENYPHLYDSCRIALGLGIVVVIGSILTVLSVSLRVHPPATPHKVVIPSEERLGAELQMVPGPEGDDKAV